MKGQARAGGASKDRGFWKGLWEDELRAPIRDFIGQAVFLVLATVLEVYGRLLDAVGMEQWLRDLIHQVFDGLTVAALARLAIPMLVRMLWSGRRAMRKDG
jgi:hypothetical protein